LLERLAQSLPALLAAALVLVVLVGVLTLVIEGVRRRASSPADRLMAVVMRSTVQRRDRTETVGRILTLAVQETQAGSGVSLLANGAKAPFRLLNTENVQRIDVLVEVENGDAIIQAVERAYPEAVLEQVPSGSRWNALSGGRAHWLVGILFGSTLDRGLFVLAYESRSRAEAARRALTQVRTYAAQVIVEFAALDQRARELQYLNGALQRQELLVRSTAHDMSNALLEPTLFMTEMEDQLPEPIEPRRASAENKLAMVASMLDDLVDPSRPLQLERIPVEEVAQLAVPMYAALAPGRTPLALDVEPELPDFHGDRIGILRIVDNLLTNAVRHNADVAGLQVRLKIRRQGGLIEVTVEDNGRGIPPAQQEAIFDFGVRVNPDGKARGYGLGLSSCRRLVRAHGGDILVESEPGRGARFRFTLPTHPLA
jgi:two-component system clock-associated histidine kinase SasA